MNMLENHTENWVAEKGGSFLNGIRTSGAIFNGSRGKFVMSVFCEGGTGPGTGRESEGNRLNGELGYAGWRAAAAGSSPPTTRVPTPPTPSTPLRTQKSQSPQPGLGYFARTP